MTNVHGRKRSNNPLETTFAKQVLLIYFIILLKTSVMIYYNYCQPSKSPVEGRAEGISRRHKNPKI